MEGDASIHFDIFRIVYSICVSLCVCFFWQRRFPHLVCFSTSNFPLWKRICVIIIVKNYSFSLHESNITNFTFALFLWFSYFHIMTIVVRTSCIAHATYYNAEYLHRIHFDESDKTLNCYLHKGINYKSVSFSRGNVIKSRPLPMENVSEKRKRAKKRNCMNTKCAQSTHHSPWRNNCRSEYDKINLLKMCHKRCVLGIHATHYYNTTDPFPRLDFHWTFVKNPDIIKLVIIPNVI